MAKQTYEQNLLELNKLETAINALNGAGIPIPQSLVDNLEKIKKAMASDSSSGVAAIFNDTFAPAINKPENAELREAIIAAVGNKSKLAIVVVTAEDGSKLIKFEATGQGSGGGAKAGAGAGTDRASTAFNHWKVTLRGANTLGYKNAEGTAEISQGDSVEFDSANAARIWILNNGKNPMNLPSTFGVGNSSVRVVTEQFAKNEVFNANFTCEGSKVAVEPKAETVATASTEVAE